MGLPLVATCPVKGIILMPMLAATVGGAAVSCPVVVISKRLRLDTGVAVYRPTAPRSQGTTSGAVPLLEAVVALRGRLAHQGPPR